MSTNTKETETKIQNALFYFVCVCHTLKEAYKQHKYKASILIEAGHCQGPYSRIFYSPFFAPFQLPNKHLNSQYSECQSPLKSTIQSCNE